MEGSIFEKDLKRTFALCDNCGICVDLCPMFRRLFDLLRSAGSETVQLHDDRYAEVISLCYDCKMCLFVCPLKLDVPELVQKAKGALYAARGRSLGARMLENIYAFARLASLAAPLSNYLVRLPMARRLLEALTGIDRRRSLFEFQRKPLHSRLRLMRSEEMALEGPSLARVAYFSGCYASFSDTTLGLDAVRLLQSAGAELVYPEQRCCELPKLTNGNLPRALPNIEYNLESLAGAVRSGYDIVTTCASCNMAISFEYPDIIRSDDSRAVSRRTYDIVHYLQMLHQAGRLNLNPAKLADRYAYYAPCHLRALRVGRPFVMLMEALTGCAVDELEEVCCGFGGGWGFRAENFDESMAQGVKLFAAVERLSGVTIATDCPLCSMQIEQGTGQKALHPVKVLARALA